MLCCVEYLYSLLLLSSHNRHSTSFTVRSFFPQQYLNLEISFDGKDYVCDRLLQFLLTEASSGVTEKLSFQLMEALLYRVHLNLFTGRMESALAILQVKYHKI